METATQAHGTTSHAQTGSHRKNQKPAATINPDEIVELASAAAI